MENIINYFYNLFPKEITNRYGGFLFEVDDNTYLICELIKEETELMKIYELLMKNQIGNFLLVYNKDKNLISKQEGKNYCLFKVRCMIDEVLTLKETINIRSDGNSSWSRMWSERINYYEIQINELAQDKLIVLNSVYYYIGLAENAIAIANKFEPELNDEDYAIQHYRMNAPVKKGSYFNPNNMLIDILIRDVAEYIKSSFFNNSKDNITYIKYLLTLPLNHKLANLLFARLLYPTYYFDLFDEIILEEREEEDLMGYIKANQKYENFLKELYESLSYRYQMLYINWLKKGAIAPH